MIRRIRLVLGRRPSLVMLIGATIAMASPLLALLLEICGINTALKVMSFFGCIIIGFLIMGAPLGKDN